MRSLTVTEFELRVFNESFPRVNRCLSLIDEDDLWSSPHENIPCIGSLVLHLMGNMRQWVTSGVGQSVDNRERDKEFESPQNITVEELQIKMKALKKDVLDVLNGLSEIDLNKEVDVQGFQVTVFSALVHVIEHTSYHTGQITLLTKLYSHKDTSYYAGQDLNKKS